ncbi:tetratricopeptide repeat protein 29 isoform X4 [Canis lupus baileyi]|uniref:tetratricopeptide repeat protein 29 isoform X4 n=1 Tax=Canis lupus familiaris TaxID=9615 RepID=UPI000BAA18EB|nr:tetratricopeptide repeat protein 29 isoform X4 [Canis lupus familiaris]XP_025294817.3 tetratricopeptide repeat protein 29 isoform X5 [Canis lupus dingo]XP_038414881.1 tetratricopeptide repeat protein 29 isoform X4 [Canis lupus familiaris]XP_038544480.1 tetratricopeptide repeat protein 29 isoform X4 [Canis lupus familiaris]|eukprot:XP_022259187.1 tetratricopeptide repeat protein 29 isoform X4 [Canis lupus familiaris]
MTTLPPLPVIRPKLTSLARKKLPCSPSTIPRSQLIKEKDDIDHYLEVNFKGLSKEEVAAYRNSYKKNICVDMLRDGYHKSFTELFALMKKWDALQETARVRSLSWLQRPLEEQPDKLDHFYHYLTRAEAAERKEYFEDVYNNLYALACYFNNSEDKWVRNHFYERCFKIAQLIKIDGGKKEAEAHAHMGLLFEEEGQLLEAAEHYEAFHQLTEGRIWKDETGRFLSLLACESLLRTYKLLSDKMLENKEYKQAIRILIKASEIAKEGSDKKMEGEASYYLGLAHLAAGEYETALTQPPFSFPSHLHLLMCQCGPPATRLAEESRSPPRLCPARPHACHCSALCATLACFVNNHLFVAGIVAAITSDLPVSSIMDRLLDVNICKSLLLNSPPGWD